MLLLLLHCPGFASKIVLALSCALLLSDAWLEAADVGAGDDDFGVGRRLGVILKKQLIQNPFQPALL